MSKDLKRYRDMSVEDLKKELLALRRDLFRVKMGVSSGQEKNTSKVRGLRRTVARVMTVLSSKVVSA